jgi:hypothetical protein
VSSIKRNISAVIYGRSGTGKTTLAATAPKKQLYLDVRDEGTDSIADVEGIDVVEINDFSSFEETYWWLRKNPDKYKSVVIDTVSQLQTIVAQEVAASKNKEIGRDGPKWGELTQRDWGTISSIMKEWLGNYRDLTRLGMDVIFIAQDRTFNFNEDYEEGEEGLLIPEVGPALSPSIARSLNASVTVIGHTFVRERKIVKEVKGKKKSRTVVEYCLGLSPNPVYIRKVRKPRDIEVPDAIVDPHWDDIVDIIRGG